MANESSTAAAQRRRVTKPLMERRRRARINRCLAELQVFLGSTIAQKNQRHQRGFQRQTRLEKADILEMTVSYIREAHYKQSPTTPLPASLMDIDSSGSDTFNDHVAAVTLSKRSTVDDHNGENVRFQEGYKLCMLEVAKFVRTTDSRRENTHQTACLMRARKREYPYTERQELIPIDKKADQNKEPSVNVPFKIRRDKNSNGHLSVSSGDERVMDLLKHLRNRFQSIEARNTTAKESLTEEDPAVGHESPSQDVQLNGSLSTIDTLRLSPQPSPLDFKREKSPAEVKHKPDSPREFVKEVICQNNHLWWRPW